MKGFNYLIDLETVEAVQKANILIDEYNLKRDEAEDKLVEAMNVFGPVLQQYFDDPSDENRERGKKQAEIYRANIAGPRITIAECNEKIHVLLRFIRESSAKKHDVRNIHEA